MKGEKGSLNIRTSIITNHYVGALSPEFFFDVGETISTIVLTSFFPGSRVTTITCLLSEPPTYSIVDEGFSDDFICHPFELDAPDLS